MADAPRKKPTFIFPKKKTPAATTTPSPLSKKQRADDSKGSVRFDFAPGSPSPVGRHDTAGAVVTPSPAVASSPHTRSPTPRFRFKQVSPAAARSAQSLESELEREPPRFIVAVPAAVTAPEEPSGSTEKSIRFRVSQSGGKADGGVEVDDPDDIFGDGATDLYNEAGDYAMSQVHSISDEDDNKDTRPSIKFTLPSATASAANRQADLPLAQHSRADRPGLDAAPKRAVQRSRNAAQMDALARRYSAASRITRHTHSSEPDFWLHVLRYVPPHHVKSLPRVPLHTSRDQAAEQQGALIMPTTPEHWEVSFPFLLLCRVLETHASPALARGTLVLLQCTSWAVARSAMPPLSPPWLPEELIRDLRADRHCWQVTVEEQVAFVPLATSILCYGEHGSSDFCPEETCAHSILATRVRFSRASNETRPPSSLTVATTAAAAATAAATAITMLEARLPTAVTLKRILEAVKDLVSEANFDCNESGIALQAMDSSHVALVALLLRAEGFDPFRCDRNLSLGVNFTTLSKVMKCGGNDDVLTVKADDDGDVLSLMFESPNNDRTSEFEIKLMDIDSEHLGIPDTEYSATIKMPSVEFQRICRDLMVLSESVTIDATKEGVKFTANGETGNGNVTLKQNSAVDKDEEATTIELQQAVSLTFSLKYLSQFAKATSLSASVRLSLSEDVPLLVEYKMDGDLGYIRYYLAPKIGDE